MTPPIIIYADFGATEWEWVCHYIINLKGAARNSALYTYIRVAEKEQNDLLRLLNEMCLEDTVTVVNPNCDMSLHGVNVIIYGSEARGFCSIYNIRDLNISCERDATNKRETQSFFHKLFVDIDAMYQNPLILEHRHPGRCLA